MARRILTLGIPAIAAYGIYRANRLYTSYPIESASAYHQSASVIPTLPKAKDFGPVEVVYARIAYPHPATGRVASPSSRSTADGSTITSAATTAPLDLLLQYFWSTWTLKLESLLVNLFLGPSIPPVLLGPDVPAQVASDIAAGGAPDRETVAFAPPIFPIWAYYPDSVVFQWRFNPDMGGVQELAAVVKDDTVSEGGQVMEISYACAQYGISDGTGGALDRVAVGFHRMYMRFLIDQAKRKLERHMSIAHAA